MEVVAGSTSLAPDAEHLEDAELDKLIDVVADLAEGVPGAHGNGLLSGATPLSAIVRERRHRQRREAQATGKCRGPHGVLQGVAHARGDPCPGCWPTVRGGETGSDSWRVPRARVI